MKVISCFLPALAIPENETSIPKTRDFPVFRNLNPAKEVLLAAFPNSTKSFFLFFFFFPTKPPPVGVPPFFPIFFPFFPPLSLLPLFLGFFVGKKKKQIKIFLGIWDCGQ